MGIVQTGTNEGRGRVGVMVPVPGYSMYQARLLQHNSYQVNETELVKQNIYIFLSFVAFINPFKSFNEIVVRLTLNSDKFEDVDEIFSMRSYWHLSLPPSLLFERAKSYQNEMLNKTNLLSETFPFPCRMCWFVGHKIPNFVLLEVLFDTPFYAECTNIPAEN